MLRRDLVISIILILLILVFAIYLSYLNNRTTPAGGNPVNPNVNRIYEYQEMEQTDTGTCTLENLNIDFEIPSSSRSYLWRGAVQSDGKILTIGNNIITRHFIDGTIDTSFGTNGLTDLGSSFFEIQDLKVDINDNIYIVSGPRTGFNTTPGILRLTLDGAIDTSYGTNGIASFNTGTSESMSTCYVFPDGRAVGMTSSTCHLISFTAAGVLDTNFGGGNGYVIPDTYGTGIFLSYGAIDVYNDQIYLLHKLVDNSPLEVAGIYGHALWRYSLTGVPDNTFGTNGRVITDNADFGLTCDYSNVSAGGIGPDGKFYAIFGAQSDTDATCDTVLTYIVRYNGDGTLDVSYGNNGLVTDTNAAVQSAPDLPFGEVYGMPVFNPVTGSLHIMANNFDNLGHSYLLSVDVDGNLIPTDLDLSTFQNYMNGTTAHPSGRIIGFGGGYLDDDENNDFGEATFVFECEQINYRTVTRPW